MTTIDRLEGILNNLYSLKEKVLVCIDDDSSDLELMGRYLQHSGYTVLSCSDGDELEKFFVNYQVVGVFTDLIMARVDGLGVAKLLRLYEIPCFVVSGVECSSSKALDCYRIGVEFLSKGDVDLKDKLLKLVFDYVDKR